MGALKYWTSYNRTQVVSHATTTGATDTTSAYAYPVAGSAGAHGVSSVRASGGSSGVSKYSYDAAGNMTSRAVAGKPAQSLSWDAEGELSKVAEGSAVKGQYVYTADGERLLRTENGKVTLYLPGGTEVTASGSVLSAQRYYQFGGQTVAVRTGAGTSGTTTIVADHHGTGVVQVAQGTNVLSRRYTDPYGQARGQAATWTGDRGFLDKTQDVTGLVAVGARYYDPGIGRFIGVDPVMDLSDPQQWNAYSYSNNNPLTWSDPSGMLPIGAGHVGYNPKQKNDPRKYDTCTHSTSCVKTEYTAGHMPVKVRYNYTENARYFFSEPRNRTTKIDVDRTWRYYKADREAAKAQAAARKQAAAEQVERARAQERSQNSILGRVRDGLRSAGDWVYENRKAIGNGVMAVAGVAAFGACIVISAGTCAIVGGAMAVASAANNKFLQGKTWAQAGRSFALDAVMIGWGGAVGRGLELSAKAANASRAAAITGPAVTGAQERLVNAAVGLPGAGMAVSTGRDAYSGLGG